MTVLEYGRCARRGTMARLLVLLMLTTLQGIQPRALTADPARMCSVPYCDCSPATHPFWTKVNCTLPHDQTLNIMEEDLPDSTTDLIVTGGHTIMFGENSLSKLKDARQIRITESNIIVVRKYAATDLDVVSVYLQIDDCGMVTIEGRAFTNLKGPLSVMIDNCNFVSIHGDAFSWLLRMSISNVNKLALASEAFMLDPTAANVGEHGPGMTIELRNTTVAEFPCQTFGSSAAQIILESVEVHAIRKDAFSANTYCNVTALNCSIHLVEKDAFAPKTLIENLHFNGCFIQELETGALTSAVNNLNISHCRIKKIKTGAINTTVASFVLVDSEFNTFKQEGFELASWNKLQIERNSFDELAPRAIVSVTASIYELVFVDNEIETADTSSLEFIGQAYTQSPSNILYKNNYYGQRCHCGAVRWISEVLNIDDGEPFLADSYCTVDEFFARCFNVPDQNMELKKFRDSVCNNDPTLKCEPFETKTKGEITEIKNPRFPHKNKDEENLSERNKKVIGIVIVTAFGCVIIVMFISFIRWMRKKGYCLSIKNFLISLNSSCGYLCDRFCICGDNNGLDNARSISQLSVQEYTERHRLNEPRVQETMLPQMKTEQSMTTDDKITQTLPEELTKELLENLREKLDDPDNYAEAREMIEHLYELVKVEENCNSNTRKQLKSYSANTDENIYELPYDSPAPRIGRNKKMMFNVGTKTPSLDKLVPYSPYNLNTALVNHYFEPKDFAVHLYAEIMNCDKDRKPNNYAMPDIVAEQTRPRGPYLQAVRDKVDSDLNNSIPPKSLGDSSAVPQCTSTTKSNKSITSNSSGKMMNRPLPEKPVLDPGEGTSFNQA